MGKQEAREQLAALEREMAEAEQREAAHTSRYQEMLAMPAAQFAQERQELIERADSEWGQWDHDARCYAVHDLARFHDTVLRLETLTLQAAGIDPYTYEPPKPEPLPDGEVAAPVKLSFLERETCHNRKEYTQRGPWSIWMPLYEAREALAAYDAKPQEAAAA